MPQIQFVNSPKRAKVLTILALWHELVGEWHPGQDRMRVTLRRGHVRDTLSTYLHSADWPHVPRDRAQRACHFDVMLRLASGRIDTMQAEVAFFSAGNNGIWFEPVQGIAVGESRTLECVRLTETAIDLWHASETAQEEAIANARRMLESDIESQGIAVALLPYVPAPSTRKEHLQALVRSIHEQAYQPVYRRKPFGKPVTGWDARLQAYFWPAPERGYGQTCVEVDAITARAQRLVAALQDGGWSKAEEADAVALAHAIFKWGGVPQEPDTVTPETVAHVFQAALGNEAASKARMNSGWTKVAAFATAHVESDALSQPQVIWDSRVAAAVISRLDAQLPPEASPAALFQGVGTVPGRGGSRPRKLSRSWPSGYQSWSGQVAGSALVREIRDILNEGGYPEMPLPGGGKAPWTTRGVEMVLFMDGY